MCFSPFELSNYDCPQMLLKKLFPSKQVSLTQLHPIVNCFTFKQLSFSFSHLTGQNAFSTNSLNVSWPRTLIVAPHLEQKRASESNGKENNGHQMQPQPQPARSHSSSTSSQTKGTISGTPRSSKVSVQRNSQKYGPGMSVIAFGYAKNLLYCK